ncbi:MAG TPA: AMP-binding protein, partial [Polyangiales bacterium]|nr:AMP-binding protein [Polyangiales bacterium]
MDKPWLQEYPPGIPAEIEPTESSTLRDMLDLSCARFGRLPAFSSMGASLTYREFDARSRALACFLQSELHLQKGARIALMLPNLLQYPVALSAALRIGATVVNVNPLYTPRELEHQLRDSGATCIVVLENFAHTVEQVLSRTSIRAVITTRAGDLLPRVKGLAVDALLKYVKRAVPSWNIPGAISFPAALRLGGRRSLEHVELTRDD